MRILLLAAMLATAAAPAAPAATDPRPDPDACKLLSDLDLEPLLFAGTGGTLDSWSNHPAPGLSTCRWEARPRNAAPNAAPRTTLLAFYHLADRQTAQHQLDRQPHGPDAGPSTAMTAGGDDALVRSIATVIVARHGADLAVVDARGADLSDPGQPEARYLLDMLALKAAGASVKSPPWMAPGTVANWAPLDERADAANPDIDWRPPANPGASASPAGQWLLHLALLVLRHGFLMLFVGILGPVAIGVLLARAGRQAKPRPGPIAWGIPVVAALVANLVFGSALSTRLLHRFGTSAAATVTGSYGTSVQYNNHDVVGHHVMLRGPDGRAVATSFEDDDFNVYPPHNATTYPGTGDVFTVRYLRRFPGDFTILADDDSPWAKRRRCRSLAEAVAQAAQRAVFSRAAADHAAWLAASRGAAAAGCGSAG